jgi:hypothetical protein
VVLDKKLKGVVFESLLNLSKEAIECWKIVRISSRQPQPRLPLDLGSPAGTLIDIRLARKSLCLPSSSFLIQVLLPQEKRCTRIEFYRVFFVGDAFILINKDIDRESIVFVVNHGNLCGIPINVILNLVKECFDGRDTTLNHIIGDSVSKPSGDSGNGSTLDLNPQWLGILGHAKATALESNGVDIATKGRGPRCSGRIQSLLMQWSQFSDGKAQLIIRGNLQKVNIDLRREMVGVGERVLDVDDCDTGVRLSKAISSSSNSLAIEGALSPKSLVTSSPVLLDRVGLSKVLIP